MRTRGGAAAAIVFLSIAVAGAQGWRALSLSTFDIVWQTVQDAHYDPTFGGVNWTAVRAELRPRVESAANESEARGVMRAMLGRLGQSHFALIASEPDREGLRGEATAPFDVRVSGAGVLVTSVVTGSSADAIGVRPGDRLTSIDGDAVPAERERVDQVPVGTQDLLLWRRVMRALSGALGSALRLGWVRPDGAERVGDITRVVEPGEVVTLGNLPAFRARLNVEEVRGPSGRRIGVVAFNVWMAAVAEPFAAAIDRFRTADGLVIDLRGNPGGLADMIRGVAGHILVRARAPRAHAHADT